MVQYKLRENMAKTYKIAANWSYFLSEIGLTPSDVLRGANLSEDLLARETPTVTEIEYFRFWEGVENALGGRCTTLDIMEQLPLEAFDPAIFAALCSADFNKAAQRMSHFKELIGPLRLNVDIQPDKTKLTISGASHASLPRFLGAVELKFFVSFIRRCTRATIHPLEATFIEIPLHPQELEDFLGVRLKQGNQYTVSFSQVDASRPFLTANAEMWRFFEPVLNQRLAEIRKEATVSERVHAALYELMPSGRTSIQDVSSMLGMSTRSLQRRLNQEETTFKDVLSSTRKELATYYLGNSKMTAAEISLLLGFDEPNSFFRAFRSWTGQTPQAMRAVLS